MADSCERRATGVSSAEGGLTFRLVAATNGNGCLEGHPPISSERGIGKASAPNVANNRRGKTNEYRQPRRSPGPLAKSDRPPRRRGGVGDDPKSMAGRRLLAKDKSRWKARKAGNCKGMLAIVANDDQHLRDFA